MTVTRRSRLAGFGVITALVLGLFVSAPATAVAPVTAAAAAALTVTSERVAGQDRYDTAVQLSRTRPGPVPIVFVATGMDFPDALAAAAAAGAAGGPLLLTRPTFLPTAVRDEIRRLGPERIVVVGGSSVVNSTVLASLAKIAPTSRIMGANRYSTAVKLSATQFRSSEEVLIATGRDYPDALVAASVAGAERHPVLLVDGKAGVVPSATLNEIARLKAKRVSIVGGYGAVSADIQAALRKAGYSVARYAGANRYDTAASVNDAFYGESTASRALIATGMDFPDALAGAAHAAHVGEPLFVVPQACAFASTVASAKRIGVASTLVLGGTAVVSNDSGRLSPCVRPEGGSILDQSWAETDISLDTEAAQPYSDRPPVDVRAADQVVDSTGLRVYRVKSTGLRADHPVVYAQYGISALIEYERTGSTVWLNRAIRQAERLIEMRTLRGDAWWYPYSFNWTYDNRTLHAPWWSAMAQGQALSLFSRLARVSPQARWDAAVDGTWQSFLQTRSASQQWSSVPINDHLYFEEYAGDQKPLQVLNGQIFAMFGVYDYWRLTSDPEAEKLLRGSSATVLDMMPRIRKAGDVSYYCVQATFCQRPLWQNQKYHVIHSWQLDTLQRITHVEAFGQWAATLRADWQPVSSNTRMSAPVSEAPLNADPLDALPLGLVP